MVRIDEMDYELQGRTGFAMTNGTVRESGGTVFIGFAAKMGITTVSTLSLFHDCPGSSCDLYIYY